LCSDENCDAEEGVPPFYTVIAREEGPDRFWKACEGDTQGSGHVPQRRPRNP